MKFGDKYMLLLSAVIFSMVGTSCATFHYTNLHRALFFDYEKSVMPDVHVVLDAGFMVTDMGLCPYTQIWRVHGWQTYTWNDPRLAWDPSAYGGVKKMQVPNGELWVPDLVTYNAVDVTKSSYLDWKDSTNVVIYNTGKVIYVPPITVKVYCEVNNNDHLFGRQNCSLKVGSWTYDDSQIQIKASGEVEGKEPMSFDYFLNKQIDIIGTSHQIVNKTYPCCPDETYSYLEMSVMFKLNKKFTNIKNLRDYRLFTAEEAYEHSNDIDYKFPSSFSEEKEE